MKKILFFAVMFCVALSTTMLVSCGGDDDEDEPKGDNTFRCTVQFSDDLLNLYKDVSVVFKFEDGTEISGDVAGKIVTFERKLTKTEDVVVLMEGTLREDVVEDAKSYTIVAQIVGKLNNITCQRTGGFTTTIAGTALKAKAQKMSGLPGIRQNTLPFTHPSPEE